MTYITNFRIYGDNILECEKTLNYIFRSISLYHKVDLNALSSPLYCPSYELIFSNKIFKFQLFPAYYNRWSSNIMDLLTNKGATLNEGPDSIVTIISNDEKEESIIFGSEYCGALPAGNNAWQRLGRPLSFAEAKIPFLYYNEIGGMELDSNRNFKAGRLPNPMVPYSLVNTNFNYPGANIFPVYIPSPTISKDNFEYYDEIFSENDSLKFIYSLLVDDAFGVMTIASQSLKYKATKLTELLSSNRKRNDTLSNKELNILSSFIQSNKTNLYLEKLNRSWKKSINIATTENFKKLYNFAIDNCVSMGSDSLAFCLVPSNKKEQFFSLLNELYPDNEVFISKIKEEKKPLALVWVAGFKPAGDDSRPDRGLLPLFKLIFGDEYSIISIIFGPMKSLATEIIEKNVNKLPSSNGLWLSLFTQSDFLLIDNFIIPKDKYYLSRAREIPPATFSKILDVRNYRKNIPNLSYSPCSNIPKFGEDDVDSVIHKLFKYGDPSIVFESLCNPPGGDWSGVEIYLNNFFYRWSSLPRVSRDNKRPDHIIQFGNCFLVVESKFEKRNLEKNIGPALIKYVQNLFQYSPNSVKGISDDNWVQNWSRIPTENFKFLSAVAYYSNTSPAEYTEKEIEEIENLFEHTNCNFIFVIHFKVTITYIKVFSRDEFLLSWLKEYTNELPIDSFENILLDY